MAIDAVTLLGFVAGTITTINLVPQAIKTWKTKKTRDISLAMYLLTTIGIFLWLVYGILRSDLPLIAANGVAFLLAGSILLLKLRYG